jgi:uridine kinase
LRHYNVRIEGAFPVKIKEGTALYDLIDTPTERKIVAAYKDNRITELSEIVGADCDVRFIDSTSTEGRRICERSLIIVLVKAVRDLYPDRRVVIRHSVRFDIFFEIMGESETLPEEIAAIEARMKELAASKIPFNRIEIPIDEAEKLFREKERQDLYNAIRERHRPYVVFYEFDGITDYSYGYLAPDSGYVNDFSLLYRYPGALLKMPMGSAETQRANRHSMYSDVPKLLGVFAEFKDWGRILGIENIGELNKAVRTGDVPDIVRVAEALQEKMVSKIADRITDKAGHTKIVLIAGPSSSGKTTFANRLSIQLRVNGFLTKIISMDNYYLNRGDAPLNEDGTRNLECPEALDIGLFSAHMNALIAGQQVNTPIYNFKKSRRDERVRPLRIGENEILMVEGIHCLNPKATAQIPREHKHRVYVSALTSLNIDDHNRIPTTDTRLIRRIVRDNSFRGTVAIETIKMWPSVRAGEEEYIFPYQESCDSMFNSGLIYELGVMKNKALALLSEIGAETAEYAEAFRLSKFLSYFAPIAADDIPPNSILREFIGGSCFGA